MSRTFSDEELESLFITLQDINTEADAFADSDDVDHSGDEDVIKHDRYLAYERFASLTTGGCRWIC